MTSQPEGFDPTKRGLFHMIAAASGRDTHCAQGNGPAEPHECPFASEINDDHSLCTCCADCEHECAMDI